MIHIHLIMFSKIVPVGMAVDVAFSLDFNKVTIQPLESRS